jgi:hypothetical protein
LALGVSDFQNISKFLNRLLGMPVELQNGLFEFFNNTLTATILDAKRSGKWDMGILGKATLDTFTIKYRSITPPKSTDKLQKQKTSMLQNLSGFQIKKK